MFIMLTVSPQPITLSVTACNSFNSNDTITVHPVNQNITVSVCNQYLPDKRWNMEFNQE